MEELDPVATDAVASDRDEPEPMATDTVTGDRVNQRLQTRSQVTGSIERKMTTSSCLIHVPYEQENDHSKAASPARSHRRAAAAETRKNLSPFADPEVSKGLTTSPRQAPLENTQQRVN